MSRATKKKTAIESCATANPSIHITAAARDDTTMRNKVEQSEGYLKTLEAMSELQKAILVQLIPLAPRAMHSEVLREAVAHFLLAQDKKGQRRELEAAVAPLVLDGFVRYFCCVVDSYALNPRHMNIAPFLTGPSASCVPPQVRRE